MKEVVLRYGGTGMALALILFLAGLTLGRNLEFSTQETIGYTVMLLALSTVFLGIRSYRNHRKNRRLSFRRALIVGLLIGLGVAIGIAVADLIYTTAINPDFFEEYASVMRSEGYRGEIPDYGNAFMAVIMFLTVMVLGLFIAILSALVLRRK